MRRLIIVLIVFPLSIFAQDFRQKYISDSAFIKMISDTVFTSDASYNNLRVLTKRIGGRLAGSPKMVKAEQWGARALKEAGADTVTLQECMVPHWIRGGKDRARVTYRTSTGKIQTIPLNILALGNSIGSGARGIKARLIRVNSFEELEERQNEVKGKIVFYNCPFEETFVQPFQAYGKNVKYRVNGASAAAKYGAVAVLIRSMTHARDNNPHTGVMRYNDSFPKIPAAAVGLRDVAKLNMLLDKNVSLTSQIFTFGKMLPEKVGHNVIGELRGTEFPEHIITVGGHLDSWDVNEGAHDDGTGVVQTIEILRAFKALGFKPRYTMRFVLFANEENGSRGAEKYAAEAKTSNEKQIFALESDAGGFTPRGFGFTVTNMMWNKIYTWKNLFEPYGGSTFTRGGGGSDIEPLAESGAGLAGLNTDSQRYFDVHHAATDVFKAVNIRELKLGAINMAALLYLVDKYGL